MRTERGRERNFTDDDINWDYLNWLKKQIGDQENKEKQQLKFNKNSNESVQVQKEWEKRFIQSEKDMDLRNY